MSECDAFREPAAEGGPVEEGRLRRHAARCPVCRDQLLADGELRRLFRGIAQPGPSLHFNRVLRERLRAERRRQRRWRWRRLVMQGYWAAASVASVIVVLSIRWPSELSSGPAGCTLGAVVGLALLTPLLLLLPLRIGPLRLVLDTMDAFRQ